MVERGLAVTYEGKMGAEFGGREREGRLRGLEGEAKSAGRGLWSGKKGRIGEGGTERRSVWRWLIGLLGGGKGREKVETPAEFKRRMKEKEKEKE